MKSKRTLAGEIVAEAGRYMPDAPTMPYFVRLRSKSFHSANTDDLADQVANYFSWRELRYLADRYRPVDA